MKVKSLLSFTVVAAIAGAMASCSGNSKNDVKAVNEDTVGVAATEAQTAEPVVNEDSIVRANALDIKMFTMKAEDGTTTLGEGNKIVKKLRGLGFNLVSSKQKKEYDDATGEEYTVTDYKLSRDLNGAITKIDLDYSDTEFEIEFANAKDAELFRESLVNSKYVTGSDKVQDRNAYVCPGYQYYSGVLVKIDGNKAEIKYSWGN